MSNSGTLYSMILLSANIPEEELIQDLSRTLNAYNVAVGSNKETLKKKIEMHSVMMFFKLTCPNMQDALKLINNMETHDLFDFSKIKN